MSHHIRFLRASIRQTAIFNNLVLEGHLWRSQRQTISSPQTIADKIVLIPESEEDIDPGDDPTETVIEGIREGWQQALTAEV
ncbi:MAG: hypothetical protein AAF215_10470 [Cyanobacteria bacterium P01_A01_bin.123]